MLLEVRDIDVYYGKSYVLRNVSFEVPGGKIVSLLGRNGAGKTTTLNTIMGLKQPKQGSIFFRGDDITALPPYKRAKYGIGYIPQEKLLFTKMTVRENLLTGLQHRKNSVMWELVMSLFPVLAKVQDRKASQLSGGEQQMLAIARALLTEPKLLILDEPSTGLMPAMILKLCDNLRELNRMGITILLVEEKIPMAFGLSDYLCVMDVGQIVFEGQTDSITQEQLLEQYMGVGKREHKEGVI